MEPWGIKKDGPNCLDYTVCIASFGNPLWSQLALDRAIPSVERQGYSYVYVHGKTLAGARNAAANAVPSKWIVFLDADDELGDGYLEAMQDAPGDLKAPAISYVIDGTPQPPEVLSDRDINYINPCCIGTAIETERFLDIKFQEYRAYEDYALFLTAYRRGAKINHVPGAVYLAHVNQNSRNNTIQDPHTLIDEIKRNSW